MPVMPYSPMHSEPLAGPEKQAEMFAKLAARANKPTGQPRSSSVSEPESSAPVPSGIGATDHGHPMPGGNGSPAPVPRGTLAWLDPVKMGHGSAMQHTQCGRYRIDALKGRNTIDFTAWAIRATPQGLNDRLGMVDSGPAARALAEAHNASRETVTGKPT